MFGRKRRRSRRGKFAGFWVLGSREKRREGGRSADTKGGADVEREALMVGFFKKGKGGENEEEKEGGEALKIHPSSSFSKGGEKREERMADRLPI